MDFANSKRRRQQTLLNGNNYAQLSAVGDTQESPLSPPPASRQNWSKWLKSTQNSEHHICRKYSRQCDSVNGNLLQQRNNNCLVWIFLDTYDTWLYLTECSLLLLFSSRFRVRFGVWLVSGYTHVFVLQYFIHNAGLLPVLCLRNHLYCVGWGVKLYSLTLLPVRCQRVPIKYRWPQKFSQ